MAQTYQAETVPRGALIGAAAVIAFAIMAALLGRITGIGTLKTPPGEIAVMQDLRFEDRQDGAVLIRSADAGRVVEVVPPNREHFLRETVRSLVRIRKREKIGAEPPFRLSRLTDGRLTLEDPATHRRIDLDAFGRSNANVFAAILDAAVKVE